MVVYSLKKPREERVPGSRTGQKRNGAKSMSEIIPIRRRPELCGAAASWFAEKWGIAREEYLSSMRECLRGGNAVPQWYVALGDLGAIEGGCGVIENDFHARRDLAPNLCALFVEPAHRGRALARRLVDFALSDMAALGVNRLYLVTDHTGLYERMGWSYLCGVLCDGGEESRLYVSPESGA